MRLKDIFGRWFKPTAKPDTRELAMVSLQDRWSSYPSVGLTPGGLGAIFQEADQGAVRRQMELFEEMEEKDAHLASLLQTRKLAVLSLDYEVLPYADTPEDQEIAAAVGEMVWRIPNLEDAFETCWTPSARAARFRKLFGGLTGSGHWWKNSSGCPRKNSPLWRTWPPG